MEYLANASYARLINLAGVGRTAGAALVPVESNALPSRESLEEIYANNAFVGNARLVAHKPRKIIITRQNTPN